MQNPMKPHEIKSWKFRCFRVSCFFFFSPFLLRVVDITFQARWTLPVLEGWLLGSGHTVRHHQLTCSKCAFRHLVWSSIRCLSPKMTTTYVNGSKQDLLKRACRIGRHGNHQKSSRAREAKLRFGANWTVDLCNKEIGDTFAKLEPDI